MFEVIVARDRTEYVTVKVRADDEHYAREAALREADGLSDELWRSGGDTDSSYVSEVN